MPMACNTRLAKKAMPRDHTSGEDAPFASTRPKAISAVGAYSAKLPWARMRRRRVVS